MIFSAPWLILQNCLASLNAIFTFARYQWPYTRLSSKFGSLHPPLSAFALHHFVLHADFRGLFIPFSNTFEDNHPSRYVLSQM